MNGKISIFMMTLFAVFACERVEEVTQPDQEQEVSANVEMTFSAVIESGDTKTILVDGETPNVKKILWQPNDAIGISKYNTGAGSDVNKFTTSISESSSKADFGGITEFASRYRAFYPYSESLADLMGYFYFDMPAVQKYVNGSFDPQASPMVASADHGEDFNFYNLCGILGLNIVGTQRVEYIMFTGYDEAGSPVALSGRFYVDPESTDPQMMPEIGHSGIGYSVTLECDEPVQLDPDTPVPFYIQLPPATYSKFILTIKTADDVMMRTSTKPMVLERSHVMRTGALEYVESVYVNLSESGHSNCYIVEEQGLYSFDATVIGNGDYGFVDGVEFHTQSSSINPFSVDLLWEDRTGIISKLSFDKGRVNFIASGLKGNAVIAVKDESEKILWSWHIWVTDKPNELEYVNRIGTYTMLDRNLGAISAEQSKWRESVGVMYQWGRKDPFSITGNDYSNYKRNYTTEMGRVPLSQAIENPSVFYCQYTSWTSPFNSSLWVPDQKTIYDPCPVGYRVPPRNAFRSFTKSGESTYQGVDYINATEDYDKGWNFIYDGVHTTYFPTADAINYNGDFSGFEQHDSDYWTADCIESENRAYKFRYYFYSYVDAHIEFDGTEYVTTGFPVRCMKDDGFVDLAYAQITLNGPGEVSTTSATFFGNVIYEGSSSVTDAGIIWGTTCDLTLESAIGVKNVGAGNIGFGTGIDGLSSATRYFVRAYAINKYGVAYSDVISFYTDWEEGTASNLSINGTSNCYLIPPMLAAYSINADVIGNGAAGILNGAGFHTSNPSITPKDVKLLWQDKEDVVYNVGYANGKAYFYASGTEGNAVIAATDADDNIIWSWHIWVTDEPQEHLYNGMYVMMDRALGSISAVEGDFGGALYYQWGRKDPFMIGESYIHSTHECLGQFANLSGAIANPNAFGVAEDWVDNLGSLLWSNDTKTIYDPCPIGWRVPSQYVWNGLGVKHDRDGGPYGVVLYCYEDDYFWYPDTPRVGWGANIEESYTSDKTEFWTSERGVTKYIRYNGFSENHRCNGDGHPVRCMKE